MAIPADIPVRVQSGPGMGAAVDMERVSIAEFNKLVTQFRALCTKLDADAGVTDTNYSSTLAAADSASPAKITSLPGSS